MAAISPESDPGKVLAGQQYDTKTQVSRRFTEQSKPYKGEDAARVTGAEGTAGVDQTPTDAAFAKVRTYDVAAIRAALLALAPWKWPSRTSVPLPDELVSVTITYNKQYSDGASSHPSSQMGAATIGGGSSTYNPRARAQGSAAIIPDIQPLIRSRWSQKVAATNYAFYVESGTNEAGIRAILGGVGYANATVNALPQFNPVSHTITAKGMRVSLMVEAETSATVSANADSSSKGYSYDWGNGYSSDVDATIRTITLPPTIHPLLTFSSTSDSQGVSVSASASTPAMLIDGVTTISAITNATGTLTATATGSVSPTSLAATTPTAIPTTGLYLTDINTSIDEFGLLLVHCEVVDFSVFA